ncbi:MAG: proteasome assembly chaperone family protein, partial [Methanomicrobiales archaeon]|nr:proteasome assembly chaperone family protein [Methanomicrobiales archaeon]
MDEIRIISKPLGDNTKTVLIGFPGSGLVGSIALQYLVDNLEFTQ